MQKYRVLLIVSIVIPLILGTVQSAWATPINPGFDLFETQQETFVDICTEVPGSIPCMIPFEGVPIGPGNTDTIVERLQGTTFPDPGPSGTIDIEIVELSLRSTTPVDLGGGGTLWDVEVSLSTIIQTPGSMTVFHTTVDGGRFNAVLPVNALLTFTEVGNPLNTFTQPIPTKNFEVMGAEWSHTPNRSEDGFPSGFFFPQGLIIEETPDGSAKHTVRPGFPFEISGELLSIDSTALIVSNAQSFSWMIPVILSGIGIGLFAIFRKSENS
jgi:hypothetical protein